ncbi:hypothetical protein JOM56_011694 [Amanita muscaria]
MDVRTNMDLVGKIDAIVRDAAPRYLTSSFTLVTGIEQYAYKLINSICFVLPRLHHQSSSRPRQTRLPHLLCSMAKVGVLKHSLDSTQAPLSRDNRSETTDREAHEARIDDIPSPSLGVAAARLLDEKGALAFARD